MDFQNKWCIFAIILHLITIRLYAEGVILCLRVILRTIWRWDTVGGVSHCRRWSMRFASTGLLCLYGMLPKVIGYTMPGPMKTDRGMIGLVNFLSLMSMCQTVFRRECTALHGDGRMRSADGLPSLGFGCLHRILLTKSEC